MKFSLKRRYKTMKHFELTCTCGNTTHTDGFYPCDKNGNEIEPTKEWNGLYVCGRCGKIHDEVIKTNLAKEMASDDNA